MPPASNALPSRNDLHNLQLCCLAPRSRTISVVTGSSPRNRATLGRNVLNSTSPGSLSRSHATSSVHGTGMPSAWKPARTRGRKSAKYVSITAGNAEPPSADVNRLRRSSSTQDTSTLNCSANSTRTDSALSAGPSTVTSAGSGDSDSVVAHVWRTSALIRPSSGGAKATSRPSSPFSGSCTISSNSLAEILLLRLRAAHAQHSVWLARPPRRPRYWRC